MTSRTFPLSRQRRRRAGRPLVPDQSGGRLATPGDAAAEGERQVDSERRAGPSSGATPSAARLPHEHDEHADVPQAPREPIIQAEADLEAGLRDTDRRGDAARVFDEANRPSKPRR